MVTKFLKLLFVRPFFVHSFLSSYNVVLSGHRVSGNEKGDENLYPQLSAVASQADGM